MRKLYAELLDKTQVWLECRTCEHFFPSDDPNVGQCRFRAPGPDGWPRVYVTDDCGNYVMSQEWHRTIDENRAERTRLKNIEDAPKHIETFRKFAPDIADHLQSKDPQYIAKLVDWFSYRLSGDCGKAGNKKRDEMFAELRKDWNLPDPTKANPKVEKEVATAHLETLYMVKVSWWRRLLNFRWAPCPACRKVFVMEGMGSCHFCGAKLSWKQRRKA